MKKKNSKHITRRTTSPRKFRTETYRDRKEKRISDNNFWNLLFIW
ncbi:MAG: hypothetical protein ACP5FK_09295 [bacterium]